MFWKNVSETAKMPLSKIKVGFRGQAQRATPKYAPCTSPHSSSKTPSSRFISLPEWRPYGGYSQLNGDLSGVLAICPKSWSCSVLYMYISCTHSLRLGLERACLPAKPIKGHLLTHLGDQSPQTATSAIHPQSPNFLVIVLCVVRVLRVTISQLG